jgi:hypothetical protein
MEIYERSRQRNHSHNVSDSSSVAWARRSLGDGGMASTQGARNQEKQNKLRLSRLAKSTPTLTQSGLLAVLLQRQRHKMIELAERRAHRSQLRTAFSSALTWVLARVRAPSLVDHSTEALEEHSRGILESFT